MTNSLLRNVLSNWKYAFVQNFRKLKMRRQVCILWCCCSFKYAGMIMNKRKIRKGDSIEQFCNVMAGGQTKIYFLINSRRRAFSKSFNAFFFFNLKFNLRSISKLNWYQSMDIFAPTSSTSSSTCFPYYSVLSAYLPHLRANRWVRSYIYKFRAKCDTVQH